MLTLQQAGRTTRMVEDIAYSMLGIFDVNMMPQYGEGVKAFARLQEALLLESTAFDETLFAWTIPPSRELRCYRKFKNQKEQIPKRSSRAAACLLRVRTTSRHPPTFSSTQS